MARPEMTSAERWAAARTYHHAAFPAARVAAGRRETVTAVVPAKDEAATIGGIVRCLARLRRDGVLDEVLVVDAASSDGTALLAERAGATVVQEDELLPEWGEARGKGDAMWRALSVVETDVVLFLDADSGHFGEHFACGTLGPLLLEHGVEFVKGFFRRPFRVDGREIPEGGGRVTELTARPLLTTFYPELARVRQPLAGEMAGRRALFERVPFACGYAVETALMIDVYRDVGLGAIAQVDLELRQNDHQPLPALAGMAEEVLGAVVGRLVREGRIVADAGLAAVAPVERPPMAAVRSSTAGV